MYKIPENEYRKNLKMFTEILELENLLDKQVKNLSLGQKMRCEIAVTFLHNPKIVYLDEPTIGLDVFVKENIRKFIKDINKEKKTTVILTTHDLKDIEDVCDRIILLDKGQIVYDGEKQKFKDIYGQYVIANLIVNSKQDNISNIVKLNNFEILEESENRLKIKFSHDKITIVKIMNEISKYCVIEDIHMKETELEDILKEIYRGVHNNDKNNDSTSKNAI